MNGSAELASISYPGLPGEVRPGDALLLGDGAIQLRVERVTADEIRAEVVVGGRLASGKGVNAPSGLPGVPILGARDLDDLRFGLERGVDFVGLSFVRTAEDVRAARAHIERLGGHVPVIAKIETQAGPGRFRRDPRGGRRDHDRAWRSQPADAVHPRADRPEATDRAGGPAGEARHHRHPDALLDGDGAAADARRGRRRGERDPGRQRRGDALGGDGLAARLQSDLIVTVARTGETARLAAKHRPAQPIVALTGHDETYRRLALVRGVVPVLLSSSHAAAEAMGLEVVRAVAGERGWRGLRAVFASRDGLWTGTL